MMRVRIEFEVESEEEFERLKQTSQLPDEKWILLTENSGEKK